MTQDNVAVVRLLFKAVEERDLAGVLAAYDPGIVIREAESLPYGKVYHGLEGAMEHAKRYAQTWSGLQTSAEQLTNPVFLDGGEHVVVLWRQRGRSPSSGRALDMPVVSVYEMRGGKIIESQMFHADTCAIVRFLDGQT